MTLNLKIKREKLVGALAKVCRVSDLKTPHPAVGKVLLKATRQTPDSPATLATYGTDLSFQIEQSLDAVVSDEGNAGVDARRFHSMVQVFTGEWIHLEHKGPRLFVTGEGNKKFSLPIVEGTVFPAQDYPAADAVDLELPCDVLKLLTNQVKIAIDQDTIATKPHLAGVLIKVSGHQVTAVTIGGYMFCEATKQLHGERASASVFLPWRTLKSLDTILDENDTVKIIPSGRRVFVATEDTLCGDLLPEMGFPPYEGFFAEVDAPPICRLAATSLTDSVKALLAARESLSAVNMSYDRIRRSLSMSLVRSDCEADDQLEASPLAPYSFSCLLNPDWLISVSRVSEGNVQIHVSPDSRVVQISSKGFRAFIAKSTLPEVVDRFEEVPAADLPPEPDPDSAPETPPEPDTRKPGNPEPESVHPDDEAGGQASDQEAPPATDPSPATESTATDSPPPAAEAAPAKGQLALPATDPAPGYVPDRQQLGTAGKTDRKANGKGAPPAAARVAGRKAKPEKKAEKKGGKPRSASAR
jgi:DNA polymerase III sliding clamp (beta) subunit (PCNA family)